MITPEAMAAHSKLSYIVCTYILTAARMNNLKRLSTLAADHLITDDEILEMERRGLTIHGMLEGKYDMEYDYPFVRALFDFWNQRLGTDIFFAR